MLEATKAERASSPKVRMVISLDSAFSIAIKTTGVEHGMTQNLAPSAIGWTISTGGRRLDAKHQFLAAPDGIDVPSVRPTT